MGELVTKAYLQATFDKQAMQLTLRLGGMLAVGFCFVFLELAILTLSAS
jgi:hypothetical protein